MGTIENMDGVLANNLVLYNWLGSEPGRSIRLLASWSPALSIRRDGIRHSLQKETQLFGKLGLRFWRATELRISTSFLWLLLRRTKVDTEGLEPTKAPVLTLFTYWLDCEREGGLMEALGEIYTPTDMRKTFLTQEQGDTHLLAQSLLFQHVHQWSEKADWAACEALGVMAERVLGWWWSGEWGDEWVVVGGLSALSVFAPTNYSRLTLLYHPHHSPFIHQRSVWEPGEEKAEVEGVEAGSVGFAALGVPFPDLVSDPRHYFYCARLKILSPSLLAHHLRSTSRLDQDSERILINLLKRGP